MRVALYASASAQTSPQFAACAAAVGEGLAKAGMTLITGGGKTGGMGAANEACRAAGGHIVGVIHEMFVVDGQEFEDVDEMVVATGEDLGERKRLLRHNADAIVCLPGGVGTLDELWDHAALRQLGLTKKPIALVNIDGYYDGSLLQLERGYAEKLLSKKPSEIFHVVDSAEAALEWCRGLPKPATAVDGPLLRKRLKTSEEDDDNGGAAPA